MSNTMDPSLSEDTLLSKFNPIPTISRENFAVKFLLNCSDAIQQTLEQSGPSLQANQGLQYKIEGVTEEGFEEGWNLLYVIRVLFYLLVIMKVVQILFNRNRKMAVRERVYRKYLFSYGNIIREFDDHDKQTMELTFHNTIRNAYVPHAKNKLAPRPHSKGKTVTFDVSSNEYVEPRKYAEDSAADVSSPTTLNLLSRPLRSEGSSQSRKEEFISQNVQMKKDFSEEEAHVVEQSEEYKAFEEKVHIEQKEEERVSSGDFEITEAIKEKASSGDFEITEVIKEKVGDLESELVSSETEEKKPQEASDITAASERDPVSAIGSYLSMESEIKENSD